METINLFGMTMEQKIYLLNEIEMQPFLYINIYRLPQYASKVHKAYVTVQNNFNEYFQENVSTKSLRHWWRKTEDSYKRSIACGTGERDAMLAFLEQHISPGQALCYKLNKLNERAGMLSRNLNKLSSECRKFKRTLRIP